MAANRFSRLRSSFSERIRGRASSASESPASESPPPPPPRPTNTIVPPTQERYSVQFISSKLGLRLERNPFSTRGAYVTGFSTVPGEDSGVSRGGLAREIRVGDCLLSCNGESLLLPTLDAVIKRISEAERPTIILFERQTANRAGFAAIIRRGAPGLAHFLDFLLHETHDETYSFHRSCFLFYLATLSYQVLLDSEERGRCARYIYQTFLSPRGAWNVPTLIVREELRSNVQEILGLFASKLLLDVPTDIFDECLCLVATSLSTVLSPFCKSSSFECLRDKKPPFQVSLRNHVLKSTRAFNIFLCYLMQTREHHALCMYMDVIQETQESGSGGDSNVQAIITKYLAPDAPLPVTCVDSSMLENNRSQVIQSLLQHLELGAMTRFIYSRMCGLLMEPAESMGDLSNMLDVSQLAEGLESHRRPMEKRVKKLKGKEGEEEEEGMKGGETKTNSGLVGDLLGLTLDEEVGGEEEREEAGGGEAGGGEAVVSACVLFETDPTTGKIHVVETLKTSDDAVNIQFLPQVDPFYIPHGVNTDLEFQESKEEMVVMEDEDEDEEERGIPGAFCFSLEFPSPGGNVPSWSCSVYVHPKQPSSRSSEVIRYVMSGIALFSTSSCQCQLRRRLGSFASSSSNSTSASTSHLHPNTDTTNTTDTHLTTLHEEARAHRETLLSTIQTFDTDEDQDTYLKMLVEALPPKVLLNLFTCALLERKILFVSNSYTMLTAAATAIVSLLQPLTWSHVLIPILPRLMLGTLECPTPFIMGIHSSYAYKKDFPFVLDLVVVNLDTGTLTMQQANAEMLDHDDEPDALYAAVNEAIRAPPSHAEIKLIQKLKIALKPLGTCSDQVAWPPAVTNPSSVIKKLFRKHVESLLNLTLYCWIPMGDEKEEVVMFDSKPFLLRHATDAQPLVKALVQTGCFSRYLTDTAGKPFCTHPTAVGGQ